MSAAQEQACTLLPSMQFATLYSVLPDGKQIFITTAGKLVCPHGECSGTICHWLREERAARAKGLPSPMRGGSRGLSICNCQSTEGLNGKLDTEAKPPSLPPSLFEFLVQQNSEMVVVKGREARRVPHLCGPTFLTSIGRLCCRHGASRRSLINKERAGSRPSARLPSCGCVLKPLPVRAGCVSVQKGRRVCALPLDSPPLALDFPLVVGASPGGSGG